MKKTALYNIHVGLNAKITPFGGYLMPIQYSSVKKEHLTVRNNLGVFDVSHMGEFFISGDNAINLLQYICSNDISKIKIGKAQYNYFPNHKGGIIDDLIVYRLEENKFMLVVNASNIDKDWNWLNRYINKYDCSIIDESENIGLISVQGPKSLQLINDIFNKVDISYNVIVGPEGDFSDLELNALGSVNLTTVNLGPRRLRSETSVIAGLANINYSLNYLNG